MSNIVITFRDNIEQDAVELIEEWNEEHSFKEYPPLTPLEAHVAAMQLSTATSLKRIADAIERWMDHELPKEPVVRPFAPVSEEETKAQMKENLGEAEEK